MTESDVEAVDLLGKSLAMDRAKAGWHVVMVERDKIGGTCINVACIPTKALVGSAPTLLTTRRATSEALGGGGAAERGLGITGNPNHTCRAGVLVSLS